MASSTAGAARRSALTARAAWADDGYAVFSMSDRGWGNSCGGTTRSGSPPVCAQRLQPPDGHPLRGARRAGASRRSLADDGRSPIDPQRDRRDRRLLRRRHLDGARARSRTARCSPTARSCPGRARAASRCRSPRRSPTSRGPTSPTRCMPNGHTLDYVADAPYWRASRIGVMKQSFVSRPLRHRARAAATTRPPAPIPTPTSTGWYALINAGEPYDSNPLSEDIVDEITTHHSTYYIDDSVGAGAAADLQRLDRRPVPGRRGDPLLQPHPRRAPGTPISLIFIDHGHQRGQNKAGRRAPARSRQRRPGSTTTCKGAGATARPAASRR